MKILLVGDLHIGVGKDDKWLQNIQSDAIQQMVDYSRSNGITTWIQAGDWFDNQKSISHSSMEFSRRQMEIISGAGIHVDVIIGNHDCYYKNTLFPNSVDELLSPHPNFSTYSKPTTKRYDGVDIDLIPWICDNNVNEIMNHISTTTAEYCMGHFELSGFYYYRGLKSHGIEGDFLKNYTQVWSGHFHTISSSGNVQYIGTPYTLTAGDEEDIRGFWVFDTDTKGVEFIANHMMWHRKISYPYEGELNLESFRNTTTRLFATVIDDGLTKFESELESVVHNLRVVQKMSDVLGVSDGSEDINVGDGMSIINRMNAYIDGLNLGENDIIAVKKLVSELYMESMKGGSA